MQTEILVLTLAGLLQVVQYALMSIPANRELCIKKTFGPRDDPTILGRLSPRTGRLYRALNNHFEALILFIIAVVVITLSDRSTGFTAACAWTYLGARVLYVPIYALGLAPWRTVVWLIGFLATVAMLVAALIQPALG